MNEERQEETREAKYEEIQEKVKQGVDNAMNSTAEGLEMTADKLRRAADFLKGKNTETLKQDITHAVKKYPVRAMAVGLLLGFIFGKVISR